MEAEMPLRWKLPMRVADVQRYQYPFTWVVADGLLGVAGRVVEGEAGAEEPEEDGGAHARDRRNVQLPHKEVPLPILHLIERGSLNSDSSETI